MYSAKRHPINPPLNIYKKIALSFIILTLVLVGVIFYFSLSYAYITIYPKAEEVKSDFNLIITENVTAENQKEGIFLGKVLNQTLEGEKTFLTTGTKPLVGDLVGKVKLTNELSKSQILIPTTRLLTADGILFRLKNRVEIPAKGTIEADVYADDLAKPLAKAGTKFTIPGLSPTLQKLVYAEAMVDFKSSGQEIQAISQDEQTKALSEFSDELAQQIFKEEDSNLVKVLNKEVIEKSFDHKVGDATPSYKLTLKIKVSGVMFEEAPIKTFAKDTLTSLVPADKQLTNDNSDKLIYEIVKADFANKTVQLKSSVSGTVVLSELSPIFDKEKLAKMKVDEIKSYLKTFEEIDSVDIAFFPSFLKKMPYFRDHIIIKIVQ
jgi:hypothetical protein